MRKFVQTRLDPVLEKGYYSTIVDKDINSLTAKRIRDSYMYFRSSSRPGALEGVDIDLLALDEYDRVPKLAEASAMESMSSSKYKIINRWSTPSVPDVGIHRLFKTSDQHWYLHKCEKCNYYNQMSYDDYDSSSVEAGGNILTVNPNGVDLLAKTVVDGSFQFVCKKCGMPLDRWYNGSWVPKYPERTRTGGGVRGYNISQLNAVWFSADALKRKELTSLSKQAFYNYTLGYPYEDANLAVVDEDIYENVYDSFDPVMDRADYRFISVGIDWGVRHWITIYGMTTDGNIDCLRLASIAKTGATDALNIGADLEAIKMILAPYNPDIIICDVGDSGDKVAQLMNYYGSDRVFGCQYPSTPKSTGQLAPTWNVNANLVKVDKLMQNKRIIAMMKSGMIRFYQNRADKELQLLAYHWKNVVIRDEEDESNGEFYQVIGRKDDDHYSQSSVYAILGIDRLKEIYYGDGNYTFNSTFIDTTFGAYAPAKPDIFSQF